jgi:hypothetical protein
MFVQTRMCMFRLKHGQRLVSRCREMPLRRTVGAWPEAAELPMML